MRENNLLSILLGVLVVVAISFFLFPIGFVGLPESLNTKQVMAVMGLGIFGVNSIIKHTVELSKPVMISAVIALTFSVWCYFCMVENNSNDDAYVAYFRSFMIWLASAYALVNMIGWIKGEVTLSMITKYLTLACLAQCVAAFMVDNNASFQQFVDGHIIQDQVPKMVDRMYGIGASLDSAGIRFATTLVLIAHQIATNKDVTSKALPLTLYIVAFIALTIMGNMIARTTSIGTGVGLFYIVAAFGMSRRGVLSRSQLRFWRILTIFIIVAGGLSVYLYNSDAAMRNSFRFAFEAFFAFFERGEFTTGSTERLNEVMWIWPHDTHGWIIGYSIFNDWGALGSDIGYCRFVSYCGVIGLVIFSLFFCYNASTVPAKFKNAKLFAWLLLSLTFIFWIKVPTDIFQFYALLFCIAGDKLIDSDDDSEGVGDSADI